LPRRRTIEVLNLAQRIEAELASGRCDDADISDEQARRIASLLRPPAPTPMQSVRPGDGGIRKLMARGAASVQVPVLLPLPVGASLVT
jgi:hypothetical protein